MLDQDTRDRLNQIKKECFRYRKYRKGPQVDLSIEAQLNRLLANKRRRHVTPADLRKHLGMKPRNDVLYRLMKKLTKPAYNSDPRIF